MKLLTLAFGFLFIVAAALSVAASLLVTASLFIADRSPTSTEFLGIHLLVSGAFLLLGVLLGGILLQIVGIVRIEADLDSRSTERLRKRVSRLLVFLVIAGAGLFCLLGIINYAILARIDEGFAVFG
jgi:hypothetical protein